MTPQLIAKDFSNTHTHTHTWLCSAASLGSSAHLRLGAIAWLLGLRSLFSFNLIADFQIFSMSFLDFMDFLTNSIMLPLGGLFIALLVGWILSEKFVREEMKIKNGLYWKIWINLTRYVAPILIGLVFIFALF